MTEEAKRIVEALRLCSGLAGCEGCPAFVPNHNCQNDLDAANLIEQLSAENERLALCRHNCKIVCLLKAHNKLLEERDKLRAELDAAKRDIHNLLCGYMEDDCEMCSRKCTQMAVPGGTECECVADWRGLCAQNGGVKS